MTAAERCPAFSKTQQSRSMNIFVVGGTGFTGSLVVRRLVASGHTVTVFHRGQTQANLPASVTYLHGDRANLHDFRDDIARLSPDVVLDFCALTEQDAQIAGAVFDGVARRVVVVSSQDVYQVYDRFLRRDASPPVLTPYTEDAPLRQHFYPYRAMVSNEDHLFYSYDKILVERAYQDVRGLAVTVLRLPQVYGPGDRQHRLYVYLKAMEEGCPEIQLEVGQATWRATRGYVDNVAAALVLAAENERAAGQVYNVAEEVAWTEAEWIRRIGDVMGWQGQIVEREAEEADEPGGDWQQHFIADTHKIREELGYREPVALDEALRRTIAWERAHPPAT